MAFSYQARQVELPHGFFAVVLIEREFYYYSTYYQVKTCLTEIWNFDFDFFLQMKRDLY